MDSEVKMSMIFSQEVLLESTSAEGSERKQDRIEEVELQQNSSEDISRAPMELCARMLLQGCPELSGEHWAFMSPC